MTLPPIWRTRFYAIGGSLIALWIGYAVAEGSYALPWLCAAALVGLLLVRQQSLPLITVLLGGVLFGYIVGNRGFAQLYLANSFPLLPAEGVLLIGGAIVLLQSAWRRELPVRRDALDLFILLWLVVGGIRLLFDFGTYHFVAVRDSATVYYALFFFVAREAGRNLPARRWLHSVLLFSCGLMLLTSILFYRFPDFFYNTLTVRGNPVIYYKADLAGTFMAVGSLLFYLRFEERRQIWTLLLSLLLAAGTIATNNRASMLGLFVAAVWLLIGGRWKYFATLAGSGALAAIGILLAARITGTALQQTPLYGVYERVVSLTDPLGQRQYISDDALDKGDNNVFRTTWWAAVFEETVETNPYTGLGFGHDFAARFVEEYYPESGDDFVTRSPHNVVLTVFGRMGLAGLLPFLGIIGLVTVRTFRAVRGPSTREAGRWCAAWAVLVSACFGVVLEGPMGAVIFWTLLGLADATEEEIQPAEAATEAVRLPQSRTPAEVVLTS